MTYTLRIHVDHGPYEVREVIYRQCTRIQAQQLRETYPHALSSSLEPERFEQED